LYILLYYYRCMLCLATVYSLTFGVFRVQYTVGAFCTVEGGGQADFLWYVVWPLAHTATEWPVLFVNSTGYVLRKQSVIKNIGVFKAINWSKLCLRTALGLSWCCEGGGLREWVCIFIFLCVVFSLLFIFCIRVNEVSVQYKCSSRQCFFHNLYPYVCFNSSGFIRPVFNIYLFIMHIMYVQRTCFCADLTWRRFCYDKTRELKFVELSVQNFFFFFEIFSFEVETNIYISKGTVSWLNFFVASLLTSVID
jgi:hypothetical protein